MDTNVGTPSQQRVGRDKVESRRRHGDHPEETPIRGGVKPKVE